MLRFAIRELLLLTVIVAMGVGWGIDRYWIMHERSVVLRGRTQDGVGALEEVLRLEGFRVEWQRGQVHVSKDGKDYYLKLFVDQP